MIVIRRSIKIVLLLASCLVFSVSAWSASTSNPAPNFTLKSLSGKNLKLSELAGNVVLINFWASWCGPCLKEMPLLNEIHNKYEPLGFTVLGVNVEQNSDSAKDFLAGNGVDFPILLDNQNRVSKLYDVVAMPTTVLVDRDGNMRFLHKGYKPGDEAQYRKMVKKLVRE
ncbi:MAG: TlpA family protein disulfide reductase [Gammaproteobacteria bacterium]|nr:TlpA family protein disulfide reductase [Gammaproteobacteria bacterium]